VTSQDDSALPPGLPRPSRAQDDRDAFAELFDAHAQHLFDYCYALLGERGRAASITQVTLIAAHSLAGRLTDTSRMRAWVLALGRWECLSGGQNQLGRRRSGSARRTGAADLAAALAFVDEADTGIVDGDTGELTLSDFEAASGLSLRAMLIALPRDDREVLDLLYRHDVSMADLPAVLGQPAASVPGLLAAARTKFAAQSGALTGLAGADSDGPDALAEQLAAVRLATMPPSIWRRAARVVLDSRFRSYRDAISAHAEHLGSDGFPAQSEGLPSGRKLLIASAVMAGLLLAPAATGGVVYAAFSTLAHAAAHPPSSLSTPSGSGSGSATSGSSGSGSGSSQGGAKRSNHKGHSPSSVLPAPHESASHSAHPKRSPTPAPTSRYSSPSSPSPSQTPTSPSPTPTPSPSPTPSPTPTPTG
jgi:DNA-directed RNA polymerase specialized sigma24 family protein